MKYAKCSSSRAMNKLRDALDRSLDEFYWSFTCGKPHDHHGIVQIRASEVVAARSITGVSIIRARDEHLLNPCISWM